jgi:hypothetical protein
MKNLIGILKTFSSQNQYSKIYDVIRQIEPSDELAQIGTILTGFGEHPHPVENAVVLKNARKIFLDYALVQSGTPPPEQKKYFQ